MVRCICHQGHCSTSSHFAVFLSTAPEKCYFIFILFYDEGCLRRSRLTMQEDNGKGEGAVGKSDGMQRRSGTSTSTDKGQGRVKGERVMWQCVGVLVPGRL